ncbi:MAG: NAD(P)-dependent oxidoreductase, partial [Candidatus Bathyarchaeia archaeon]
MSRFKILVLDNFDEVFFKELKEYGQIIKADSIEGLETELVDVEILVVRSNTKVDVNLVDRMPKLRVVITATHGEDHIDRECLRKRKISYYNAPVQTMYVAQGAIAAILALHTRLVEGDASMKRGMWRKKDLIGYSIFGKALGIIGYGRIGREVARLALALGMKVCVYDPYVQNIDSNVVFLRLDELLRQSDVVSVHTPLTDDTRNLIGKKEIDMMKDGAFLINISRGGIVDEKALLEALKSGKL